MTAPNPISMFRFTEHARFEMARRGIVETDVAEVLAHPEQAEVAGAGRMI